MFQNYFSVIEQLDPDHKIVYRLFKDSTKFRDNTHMKVLIPYSTPCCAPVCPITSCMHAT